MNFHDTSSMVQNARDQDISLSLAIVTLQYPLSHENIYTDCSSANNFKISNIKLFHFHWLLQAQCSEMLKNKDIH